DLLRGKTDAGGQDTLLCPQRRDGQIEIAGAVTDAVAAAVERQERHDENVGLDLGRVGLGLADAPDAGRERLAPAIGAPAERLAPAPPDPPRQPRVPGPAPRQRPGADGL